MTMLNLRSGAADDQLVAENDVESGGMNCIAGRPEV